MTWLAGQRAYKHWAMLADPPRFHAEATKATGIPTFVSDDVQPGQVIMYNLAEVPRYTMPHMSKTEKMNYDRPLPSESAERKSVPVTTGVLDYFPAAIAEVAKVSKAGNDKHNPGEPMHHARGKSTDHADSIGRHLMERGGIDPDTGVRHSAELAWRALALLQQELEDAGLAPLARGARVPEEGNSRDRRGVDVRVVAGSIKPKALDPDSDDRPLGRGF
jgi:hypothetical protein